jgi:transcriptional regulator with XRE-family HTH domain
MRVGKLVAQNIRRYRKAHGFSQEGLAHRMGINRNYIGRLEREEHSPTVEMLERIAKALNVETYMLLLKDSVKQEKAPEKPAKG